MKFDAPVKSSLVHPWDRVSGLPLQEILQDHGFDRAHASYDAITFISGGAQVTDVKH